MKLYIYQGLNGERLDLPRTSLIWSSMIVWQSSRRWLSNGWCLDLVSVCHHVDNVKRIKKEAFSHCTAVLRFIRPSKKLEFIADGALGDCDRFFGGLILFLPSASSQIDWRRAFWYCCLLRLLILPSQQYWPWNHWRYSYSASNCWKIR